MQGKAASEQPERRSVSSKFEVNPVSTAIGAEIRGVDLAAVDDGEFEKIHQAWLENLVLLFRNQRLDDTDLERIDVRQQGRPALSRLSSSLYGMFGRGEGGGAGGNRTRDLLNAIQALSQLSYGPTERGS